MLGDMVAVKPGAIVRLHQRHAVVEELVEWHVRPVHVVKDADFHFAIPLPG
jgi:hypothetical protein